MRISVRINQKDDQDFVRKEVRRITAMSENDTERLAKRTESVIRYMIENKCDGGTGNLANSPGWDAEPIKDGWGVGDIAYLNQNVKYWRHINYGSEAIGANWEHFLPQGFWRNGRWVESDTGYYGIKPTTPIEAKNYIEDCLAQMFIETPKILKG